MHRLKMDGLDTVICAGTTYSSREALIRYIETKTQQKRGIVSKEPTIPIQVRQERAKRRLAGHGIQ
jgi:hypothetical protein